MSLLDSMFGAGANSALGMSLGAANNKSQLEQQMLDMRAQQYTQQLAQSMAQTKQAVTQNIYTSMAAGQAMKPFNPNEQEAYTIALSQLVTLWQAKYGDTWVEKFDEDFWIDALARLKAADKLEKAGGWYRIKEDA